MTKRGRDKKLSGQAMLQGAEINQAALAIVGSSAGFNANDSDEDSDWGVVELGVKTSAMVDAISDDSDADDVAMVSRKGAKHVPEAPKIKNEPAVVEKAI